MELDESRFAALADRLLERLADAIDEQLGDEVDAEAQGGILTLSLPGGGQYVINKHASNREVWLSSPVSGAWHFAWDGEAWISTRAPRTSLVPLLEGELAARCGRAVSL